MPFDTTWTAQPAALVLDTETLEDITDFVESLVSTPGEKVLPKGTFRISRTIRLPSECHVAGYGDLETTLVLANATNNNMFTNLSHEKGGQKIRISNLRIDGNQEKQFKPPTEKRLSFCNAVYFASVRECSFDRLVVQGMLQTALHFRRCSTVNISRLYAAKLGWSGISTSGTDDIIATDFTIYDSGNDHRHSAVHLDGGTRAFLRGTVEKCVGNGIMLDSTYAPFSNAVVHVTASRCMRGVALIGGEDTQPHSVAISECHVFDNDIGLMVSNARSVFMSKTTIERSRNFGVLFQGRVGGTDSFVSDCVFSGNAVNIAEHHESRNNVFMDNRFVE